MANVIGMKMRGKPYKVICDFDGPGHSRIIMPNHDYYKVTSGKAQGTFHGPRCYQAALQRYEAEEKKLKAMQEAKNSL